MREPPPAQLAALLTQLGLATQRDFERVEATVHRMAGDLPRFESIWIDALRQARFLTHFQACEIHAGRGPSLAIGRYVLCHCVQECGYSTIYRAEDRQTGQVVRITVFAAPSESNAVLMAQLDALCAAGKRLPRYAGIIDSVGTDGSRLWAASPWFDGLSLAEWILHHGRFPPDMVLEIARVMTSELAAQETSGVTHGDIRLETVLLAKDGEVCLPHPGLRGVIRPQEGISQLDLPPEACSTLAPERVTRGTPPSAASDLFACGCVWWHMLCGRPPLGGGDTLARLRAAQAASIDDLHRWAADVPELLAQAIESCLQKDPQKRPKSMAELSARLGPLRRQGRQAIVRHLAAAARPRAPWLRSKRKPAKKPANPHRITAAALAILAALAIAWPQWVAHSRSRLNASIAKADDVQGAQPLAARGPVGDKTLQPNSHRPIFDPAVKPAGFTDVAGRIANPSDVSLAADRSQGRQIGNLPHDELRLPSDRPIHAESLQLKAGQRVRAENNRARIIVPREGLAVHANRIRFENIDFVVERPADATIPRKPAETALIRLLAPECDFSGCSFQSENGSPELSAAVDWRDATTVQSETALPPPGRLRMRDCVFRRVRSGVESGIHGAISMEFVNCMYLGPGAMLCLTRAPAADEPLHLLLSQVTLRESDALLDCRCTGPDDRSGEIAIEASGCVLAPRRQAAIFIFTADVFPRQLLRRLKWSGQGSVLAGKADFGRWRQANGGSQTIDDATISIAGLVRGEVEFAGTFGGQPANSRVVNCQAPLQDSESAGAAEQYLPPELAAIR
jgi:eukaryotic-like serine/threonine-protein kinase